MVAPNNRLLSPDKFYCNCEGLPEGFKLDEAWLVGASLWLETTDKLNKCIQVLEMQR